MNNNFNKKKKKSQNINIVNLAFCLLSLTILMIYKFINFTIYGTMSLNIFDMFTIVISTLGSILSITYLKFKAKIVEEAIAITLCTLSLFFGGLSLFAQNNPFPTHMNFFIKAAASSYLLIFIFFLINKVRLDIYTYEIPIIDIQNFIIPSILAGLFITMATAYSLFILRVYYNNPLSMCLGIALIYLGAIYTIVVAFYVKKIILKYKI